MAKAKGAPKSGGRQKGSLNKMKLEVKAAIAAAFDEVGGKDYLIKLATSDPRTFCALVGKIVPLGVAGDPDNPLKHIIHVVTGVPRE
jgi:hypothetical protein